MQYTLAELSVLTGAQLIGKSDQVICGVNTLEEATPTDASFLSNSRYNDAMKKSKAGVICSTADAQHSPDQNYLISADPSQTFQQIAILLIPTTPSAFSGIHPSAVIHPSAHIGKNVTIAPHVCIDRDVFIGDNTHIYPNVTIGHEVTIGSNCTIFSNVTIREKCRLGNRVILQPGAVIGSCGFGYVPDKLARHIKLEQLGIVILEDDVEIGANTTIDRSRFKVTLIRKGTKIDNLVQIGHNVEIGEYNIIAAQTGVAGSAKTGKHVMIGGQAGIVGHVELEDQVMVATRAGVSKSLKTGKYRGSPAIPISEFHRQEVHVRKLEEYVERLRELEKKLNFQEAIT